MQNSNTHINEKNFDALLRQLTVEHTNDNLIQKTLDMNSTFIFNQQAVVIPSQTKEAALIQKLENDFIKRGTWVGYWLKGILTMALLSCVAWIMINMLKKNYEPLPKSNKNSTLTPIIYEEESNKDSLPEQKISKIYNSEIIATSDSVKDQTPITDNTAYYPPAKRDQQDKFLPVNEEKDLYPAPEPVFTTQPTPDNYKLAIGNFTLDSINKDKLKFKIKQNDFTASYYNGELFKKGIAGMIYINYGDYIQSSGKGWTLPSGILSYSNIGDVKVEEIPYVDKAGTNKTYPAIMVNKLSEKGIGLTVNPFYFSKFEVTNKEYREFTEWVRSSNGYGSKLISHTKIDTVPVTDEMDKSSEQITISGKKFKINRKTTQLEDYKKVFSYRYFKAHAGNLKNDIYVLPDTASWVSDFEFSYNLPMVNYYFWHPAYDNYPVIGISWHQAMAFLDWKTHMHQKQLDASNTLYEIEYTLPSDIQWEIVSMASLENKILTFKPTRNIDNTWITNLGVNNSREQFDQYKRTNYLKNLFTADQYYIGSFMEDGYFHTGPVDLTKEKNIENKPGAMHLGPMDISWLDGNVSEWMIENYSENRKPFFDLHLQILEQNDNEGMRLAKMIEEYFEKGNATDGRLVRGANWYDERFGQKAGSKINDAGISPRCYLSPDAQHSTVGFRYVITVKLKDEALEIEKLNRTSSLVK